MSEEQKYLIDSIEDSDKPEVELVGQDGNVFAIMGRVKHAWDRIYNIPNNQEIAQEYLDRIEIIKNDHHELKYERIVSLSWEYIQETGAEDEQEYNFSGEFDDDEEDEE